MTPSSSKEEQIVHQYDSFAKKTLSGERKSYIRALAKRADKETCFSALSPSEMNQLYIEEEFCTDYHSYIVFGYDISVKSDILIEALDKLSQKKRDIVLLSYFLDMSDAEIGKLLHIVRETVFRNRKHALKEMKNYISKGGNNDEETKD